jgi:hypothetical protein
MNEREALKVLVRPWTQIKENGAPTSGGRRLRRSDPDY